MKDYFLIQIWKCRVALIKWISNTLNWRSLTSLNWQTLLKWGLLLQKRICSHREQFFSVRAAPIWKSFTSHFLLKCFVKMASKPVSHKFHILSGRQHVMLHYIIPCYFSMKGSVIYRHESLSILAARIASVYKSWTFSDHSGPRKLEYY